MKTARLLRLVVYYGFAQHLPASDIAMGLLSRRIRRSVCRGLFRRMGNDVNIEKGAHFGSGQGIELGDYSGIGINCRINGPVSIGNNVMMAPDVVIISRKHCFERTDIPMNQQGEQDSEKVTIDDDVWIGSRAILLPGIRVNKGSIVAAGAVVTKDVPPYSIVGGNPARIIRSRK